MDIVIGKSTYIGPEVQLNRRVTIGDRSHLSGHVVLGEGVQIGVGVELSAYPGQTLALDDEVEVLSRNIIKGNLRIGAQSRIESGVLMTGSDEHPMRVGERVIIKGTSYLLRLPNRRRPADRALRHQVQARRTGAPPRRHHPAHPLCPASARGPRLYRRSMSARLP